jgi:hypothetical protein
MIVPAALYSVCFLLLIIAIIFGIMLATAVENLGWKCYVTVWLAWVPIIVVWVFLISLFFVLRSMQSARLMLILILIFLLIPIIIFSYFTYSIYNNMFITVYALITVIACVIAWIFALALLIVLEKATPTSWKLVSL